MSRDKDIYMESDEKFLFISVINNKENTITFLDSNDILSENNEIVNNFKFIYEKFFESLIEKNFIKKQREFKYQIDPGVSYELALVIAASGIGFDVQFKPIKGIMKI